MHLYVESAAHLIHFKSLVTLELISSCPQSMKSVFECNFLPSCHLLVIFIFIYVSNLQF